jgi:hypothetical protein
VARLSQKVASILQSQAHISPEEKQNSHLRMLAQFVTVDFHWLFDVINFLMKRQIRDNLFLN